MPVRVSAVHPKIKNHNYYIPAFIHLHFGVEVIQSEKLPIVSYFFIKLMERRSSKGNIILGLSSENKIISGRCFLVTLR